MKKTIHAVSYVFLIFVLSLSVALFALPKESYSENEKHELAAFPPLSAETLFNGEFFGGLDDYVSDHFPLRTLFVGINAYFNLLTGRNGLSGVYKCGDGYLIAAPAEFNREKCASNVKILDDLAGKENIDSLFLVIPSPGFIMEDKLPKNHKEYHDDEIFDILNKTAKNAEILDLRKTFKDGEDALYYRTDHHMTAVGSYLAYVNYCYLRGLTPIGGFKDIETVEGFYGTNYSKSGLWYERPDDLEIYHSPRDTNFKVTIREDANEKTYDSLYFYDHRDDLDKYPIFLDGNHAYTSIENEDLKNGERVLIIKDSYAHCFSTYLCENFETTILIDPRYYRGSIDEIIKSNEIDEMIFLFGSENLASSSDIAFVARG